jgi:predicted Fe-Mo cluster-binding NifX family protein
MTLKSFSSIYLPDNHSNRFNQIKAFIIFKLKQIINDYYLTANRVKGSEKKISLKLHPDASNYNISVLIASEDYNTGHETYLDWLEKVISKDKLENK